MSVIISILRGINVSGKNKIPMMELKAIYEKLKFKHVTTYIQSGNVIFCTQGGNPQSLSKKIEKSIFEKFGLIVPVITRSVDELQSVMAQNPFLVDKNINREKLHITYLEEKPAEAHLKTVKEYNYEPDKFVVVEKEVFLYCPISYGNSKLNNSFFENKLKVRATTRNWKTTNELFRIASNIEK